MGPGNPWSPEWRPDPSGRRLAAIRTARRGALLAAAVYMPVAAIAIALAPPIMVSSRVSGSTLAVLAFIFFVGLPAVALLGAALAPAALGSRVDAVAVGVAFAIGAPVAAVASLVIGAVLLSVVYVGGADLVGVILRAGVQAAIRVAPLVALGSIVWVVAVRRRPAAIVPLETAPTLTSDLELDDEPLSGPESPQQDPRPPST